MSLSKAGRIILGKSCGEMHEDELEVPRVSWDAESEERLLQRVRQRAKEEAKSIIAEAQQEAASIRSEAYAEGLQSAQEETRNRIREEKRALQQKVNRILGSLDQEKDAIWKGYKEDILQLIALAVEKVLLVQLDEQRREVLAGLLDESLELLDTSRECTLYVCSRDEELVASLLEETKARYPHLSGWQVKASSEIEPGGLILENAESKVDNTVSNRWQAVRDVLEQIGLNGNGA